MYILKTIITSSSKYKIKYLKIVTTGDVKQLGGLFNFVNKTTCTIHTELSEQAVHVLAVWPSLGNMSLCMCICLGTDLDVRTRFPINISEESIYD